jgi:hypothetical protein
MGVWSAPRLGHFTPGNTRYPLYRRARQMRKTSPSTGIRFPDRPTRSESLYRLSYPGPHDIFCNWINLKSSIQSCYINKYNFGVCLLTDDNRGYILRLKISHCLVTSKHLYTSVHTAYSAFKMSMSTLWPFVNHIMCIPSSEFCIHVSRWCICSPVLNTRVVCYYKKKKKNTR